MSVWYASFGSNLSRHRFGEYLQIDPDSPDYPEDRWLLSTGQVYFAEYATRWGGAPAFYDPAGAHPVVFRCYRLRLDQLASLWAGENGLSELPPVDLEAVHTSPATPLTIDSTGKYETLLPLDAPSFDAPVFTITTTAQHERGQPSEKYLSVISSGLAEAPLSTQFIEWYDLHHLRRPSM